MTIKACYKENQELLNAWGCKHEKQFITLITKKYKQKSKIELQQRIINQIIAKNAKWSYLYAEEILHGPFLAGEPAIAKNAKAAYWYAADVLHGSFPAGEPAIAKDAGSAYYWEILNG